MKVICIKEPTAAYDRENNPIREKLPPIYVGNEYTVIHTVTFEDGDYYILEEIPFPNSFHETLFATISNIDERELVNEMADIDTGA